MRHEELAIQQEMAKIRKEMEIEKKQRTEEKLKCVPFIWGIFIKGSYIGN